MTRTVISTNDAPKAIGPYSQAIRAGGFLFTAGQIALDPATGEIVAGDVKVQATRVLDNLRAVLAAGGSSFERVVKTTMYLADMNDFAAVNEVYGKYFVSEQAARSTVQVARLPRDSRVEIEVIAMVD